ncbi:tungsten cofactor oxidoreductase radical SAM maturase [Natranaerofaba carboxydovora]|uniref:tungsten cofactor oxidoreductase radical SAM maturase n=1 Tax=Natranaerofaba carboxydovora TaxID=2742683 RepID=UPI001F129AE6|nr:tungsten cofactor oxidoreductase radical SAM maturase [Natranaerofaba carboxydovora]UMZ74194.1 Putative mycofactocin radical SAM maturase MftC [Natranaerofaba carboxydovora]
MDLEKINLDFEKDYIKINQGDGIKLVPKKANVKKLYIELTTECNFDCITCIRNSWDEAPGHMPGKTLSKILKQIDELSELHTVHLGGFGEPSMHPEFLNVLETIKQKNIKAEFITNGNALKEEYANKILEIGVDRIIISVDAPEKESFEKIRLDSDFEQLINRIEYINSLKKQKKSKKPELWIEFVAMKSNYKMLPDLVKMAGKYMIDSIIVTNLLPYTKDMVNEILYDANEDDLDIGSGGGLIYFKSKLPEMKLRTTRYCNFVESNSMVISRYGQVSPCYSFLHQQPEYIYGRKKLNKKHYFGDTNKESLKDIWQKEDYIKYRSNVKDAYFPSCTDCKYLEGCSMTDDNSLDCWGNSPTCADCLWYRGIIICP